MRFSLLSRVATSALFLSSFGLVHATELITNGGFDQKDASNYYGAGWTVVDDLGPFSQSYYFSDWSAVSGAPTGVSAWLGSTSDNTVELSQDVNTAGYATAYLSFDLYSDGWDLPGYDFLDVYFGGTYLGSVDVGSDTGEAWDAHVSANISSLLSGGVQTLSLVSVNDSSYNTFVWVDNVSIDARAGAVPEPASLAVIGMGMAAFARRKKKA